MTFPSDLIDRMTLAEKIGQLNMLSADYAVTGPVVAGDVTGALRAGRVGSIFNLYGRGPARRAQKIAVEETRLGIPLFFAFDVIHGFRTVFPMPLAEAGAFDPALWEETAREAATESAEAGLDLVFAPMLDIARDPRWGRGVEGPGEDPLVAMRFARAKVRGYQGRRNGSRAISGVVATVKHFVGYGASRAGRDYAEVDLSERELAEVYLPPFQAGIAEGAAALMPAFTDIGGLPLTAHKALITGKARGEWGFDGLVISDYGAIGELIPHGVAGDLAEAAALALNAGVDVDMVSYAYEKGLDEALSRGRVTMETLNAAVLRVLDFKDRLGLFDDPYRRCQDETPEPAPPTKRCRAVARKAAAKSMVLLKNEGGALPLDEAPGRIALIGPLTDARDDMLGSWAGAGRGAEAVGVLEGLKAALPGTTIDHARGVTIDGNGDDEAETAKALDLARKADHVVLCIGEAGWMSGEAASRARIDLPGRQEAFAEKVLALGRPVIVLLFAGRPIVMPEVFEKAAAVVMCWFPGTEAGPAVADILTGRVNPTARMAVTWPQHVGQVPIHYAARRGGRPLVVGNKYTSQYLDMPNAPLLPFGAGLSYTTFSLTEPSVTMGDKVEVETIVTNDGARAGEAVVFLFLTDPVARIARPVLELKDFARIELAPGETHAVTFWLDRDAFAYPGADLKPLVEPGDVILHVGFSADPAALKSATIRLD
ncbi:glycoside hydrolase family 3 N-terminal domain-containing protein [Rhodobium gokarnense]|uniref:beta-glucosidase n=1 Tax=Rhodobium gokarnense TaxID=364296 RepID=A0ABT3HF66_9HYPH|nr:glycoside hydrolase family 3 N-terminal domain-containing protein [Rhodobium gokarnense]MCW2309045.1 beta-glucosidase [Rhodobium gokarnense]